MAKYRAKCASFGFNGRYWDTGDVGEFTAAEIKKIPKEYFDQLFEKDSIVEEKQQTEETQ